MVLIGAAMPSVLAEISFLTNPQDLALVRTAAYRQRIAEGLFDAIRKYQTSLKTDQKVAQPFLRSRQIFCRIHGAQNRIIGDLCVEGAYEAGESFFADGVVDLFFVHPFQADLKVGLYP